jgi:hypothetical protein
MRPITTALAISAFAVFAGAAHAESTMSSGDLIKEMHPDSQNSADLQTGRNAAGGEGPSLNNAAREDGSNAASGGNENLRSSPQQPIN